MLLHPDYLLRKMQPRLLEGLREVANIGVSAPDKKQASGLQCPSNIAEPGKQQPVELGISDEVAGQRTVLGPQLLPGGFGLCRMPSQVERLMVLETLYPAGSVVEFPLR